MIGLYKREEAYFKEQFFLELEELKNLSIFPADLISRSIDFRFFKISRKLAKSVKSAKIYPLKVYNICRSFK